MNIFLREAAHRQNDRQTDLGGGNNDNNIPTLTIVVRPGLY